MNALIAQFSSWLWQQTTFLRSSAGLAILAVAFVGLRLLWIHIQRPAHLEANAAAYGAIRNFYGPAQFNHDGSQFIYAATADDRGRAVFLCDTLTGKKQQMIEDTHGVGIWNDDFDVQAGPWSPDDRCFICVVSNRLMVCPVDTNQKKAVIEDKPYSEAVWLTPTEFAYVTEGTNLCVGEKREDGQWEHRLFRVQDLPITSLTAISPDTVVWLENSEVICRADLSEGGGDATSPNSNKSDEASPPHSATGASQPPTNGLALWLDASKLREPDQALVMDLPDLSRSRNDAVRNGTPPVFNATNSPRALNGKGTIHFASGNSISNAMGLKTIRRPGIINAMPRTVFAVLRRDRGGVMMAVNLGQAGGHGTYFGVYDANTALYLPGGWDWLDNTVPPSSGDWNLLEVVHDGVSQKGYVNGVLKGTTAFQLATADKEVEIGLRTGSEAAGSDGDFAELLIYDRALSLIERKQAEDYLNAKWFGKKSSSSQNPVAWYNGGLDGMTGLAFSKETGELLISRTEGGRDSVWRLDTTAGTNASPILVIQGQSVRGAQWAGPDALVYASRLDTRVWIKLADLAGTEKKQLLQLWGNGSFDWFKMTADRKQLFLFGNITNAPAAGIQRYELASDTWHPVISVSDYPSSQGVTALHEPMNLPGGNVTCTIYRPANFDPHKKYPLVIGDTMITDAIYGEPFMTGMAACGACVAVVERPWWTVGIEQWAQNVQGLYEQLKNDPTVDTRRVYLFAASAETQYLSQMVETNPAPWRGLILLNPGALPDFSKSPRFQLRPKILLDAGGEEHDEARFKQYQTNALNSGVVVEFFTHPGETHRMVGSAAKLERARLLAHFIFEE